MKEATGELSMTVVTIVAIVAIAGVVAWLMPSIRQYINKTWQQTSNNVINNQFNKNNNG